MRVIFMGTPDFAVPSLEALVAAGHDIVCVYTQPPRPAGRGKRLQPSPVQVRAEELGIDIRSPVRLRGADEQAEFAAWRADVAVVAAYGLILPQPVLAAPKHGCINVHASLLPRWRGAAPIHRAILAGDAVTGVTIMQMEAGLDTGPMLAKADLLIGERDAAQLTDELAKVGADLLVEVLADLGAHPPVLQPEDGVTYAAKIDKSESRLDFSRSAEQVTRQVRAFGPVPGAWFDYRGERIRILEAAVAPSRAGVAMGMVIDDELTIACGSGAIRPIKVQRAGRGVMSPDELLRGFPIAAGTRVA